MSRLATLLRKDRQAMVNLGRVVRQQSRFKVAFILVFAAGLTSGLFLLFLHGFEFLSSLGGAGFMIIHRLFSLFFLGLAGMLVLSSILTCYSCVFRSREVPFLMVHPFEVADIVSYKFIESTILGSWALLLIIVPFAAAYGWHQRMGLRFCLWTALFSIPLLVLCSGIGALAGFAIARWLPRRGRIGWALLAGLFALLCVWRLHAGTREPSGAVFMLSGIVPGLRLASHPLLPSRWTAEGIMACTRGQLSRGLMLWCVLVSNTMMVCLLVQRLGERTFYAAFQRITGTGSRRRRHAVLLRRLESVLSFLARDVRGIIMKDTRDFLRDPVQWSQVLIFFGLLGLYFGSIGSFQYDRLRLEWRNLIAFLNVFSVAAVQCSLASRFVFPQLSMEGQAFWVIGMSPTSPRRILMTKFLLSVSAMLVISVALISLSARMLQVEALVKMTSLGVTAAISCGLCGLAVGLGAVFVDLKQSNPMAIVSGFGGTVNLVLSLAFMLACIVPFGLLFHLFYTGILPPSHLRRALVWTGLWLALLTLAATALPLWLGQRRLLLRVG